MGGLLTISGMEAPFFPELRCVSSPLKISTSKNGCLDPQVVFRRHSTGSSSLLAGVEREGRVNHSPSMNPRDLQMKLLAKVNGCIVEACLGGCRPKVQLISSGTTTEAAIGVFAKICRERPTSWRRGPMYRTRSSHLIPLAPPWDKTQQFQDLGHGHFRPHGFKVNARHQHLPRAEKRNPYFRSLPTPADPAEAHCLTEPTHRFCGRTIN